MGRAMHALRLILGACIVFVPATTRAEFQISAYGGANTANGSDVTLDLGASPDSFDVDWFGDSFNRPPYYGFRGTYWLTGLDMPEWGIALDFTHAKVEADLDDPSVGAAFSRLEFTNGLNSLTLNGLYRIPIDGWFTIYAGAGAGASIPHVEVSTIPATFDTRGYQVTGPVAQAIAGASIKVWQGFSVFGEYKASYSWNEADLDGGGSLETDILAHHFALGVSLSMPGLGF
jgi:lipid A oxidase